MEKTSILLVIDPTFNNLQHSSLLGDPANCEQLWKKIGLMKQKSQKQYWWYGYVHNRKKIFISSTKQTNFTQKTQ